MVAFESLVRAWILVSTMIALMLTGNAAHAQIGFLEVEPKLSRSGSPIELTLGGRNLDQVGVVKVGGKAAEIISQNARELRLLVDSEGLSGSLPISIHTSDGRQAFVLRDAHRVITLTVEGEEDLYLHGDRLRLSVKSAGLTRSDVRLASRAFSFTLLRDGAGLDFDLEIVVSQRSKQAEDPALIVSVLDQDFILPVSLFIPAAGPIERQLERLGQGNGGDLWLRDLRFGFVRVAAQKGYDLGLSERQASNPYLLKVGFAKVSSHRDGPVNVPLAHDFLIQTTEVTNEQYWRFLRTIEPLEGYLPLAWPEELRNPKRLGEASTLPQDLRRLPVSGISHHAATAFAEWLQQEFSELAPAWVVRLPHEIEWEMAARGTDGRDFVFSQAGLERGLASTREPGARSVGSNPLDVSWCGARDMCGSVREWTACTFDPNLLTVLDLLLKEGSLAAWDACLPFARQLPTSPSITSDNGGALTATTRGGANGEEIDLMQVGLRRPLQYHARRDIVGFRLLLVRQDGGEVGSGRIR